MPTPSELAPIILWPVLVAAVIAGIGRWRKWAWTMPVAAGAGFLAGYASIGVPKFPPVDGTDWLFWLTIPLVALGVLDALVGRRWGWALGAAAGPVALVVLLPIVPGALSMGEVIRIAIMVAVVGAVVTICAHVAEPAGGPPAVVAGLCIALGGAAVVVLSSNVRIVGLYGIAASAALGPIAVLTGGKVPAGRSVAVVCVPLLAGLLVGGRYYADPGVSVLNFSVLIAAPALLLLAAAVPGKRAWVRGVVAVLAVAVAVGWVTGPTALAAKRAAEATADDPYAAYR
jgi:hypothetical protein